MQNAFSFLPRWEDIMDDEEASEPLPELYGDDFEEFHLLVGMAVEKKTKGFANNKTTSIICLRNDVKAICNGSNLLTS
uniref:Alpha-dioxygenase 1 n=1 Tax=Tanacetum cinerariifolium TaxID=118510 RepID=A0A699KEL3_TANCI|nr:alpha-dioxygenase 1 [Tanacetum cinerariifolium]